LIAGSFEGSVAAVLVTAGADIAIAYSSSSSLDRISIRLSRRALARGFDAVTLLERLKVFGAACGGHRAAAGCKLPPKKALEAVDYLVDTVLNDLANDVRSFGVRRY
jgi:nanoRNase/pAp phosphatase (c-di-AMP/oligoRNAs hydrolase)